MYLVLNVSMAHSDDFETMCNALKVSTVPSALSEGRKMRLKSAANGYFRIFIRLQLNFGFESHNIVLYSVLNALMTHTDVFETMCNALKVSTVPLDPSGSHSKT